ncbi:MAG: FliA/WhiG family RNA polymerase sigma factor [Candidatus Eremiobacteraeota bacterium]|nr:FliA/WhiG family RNA polymerase sigma factor [Candidatus Eremiobacteraeota bacterium]MBV8332223.1 FliA/WhiG family RNA polymerase sigma factor [Candidatus Eremiobacteraeota bacterium]MBV8435061.1 FliA/WhiG family RNA polymerase sigma factor [Candidatus Eremiobacteraeota bacterium]MBV8655140.1 FliA/WhiG family RNA polymerase sigma factor [Candidatus Eremiobacteraeota bacterium]
MIGGIELSREEIVHKYLHLVKYVAGRISVNLPPNVEINDLINDGILGLIDAIEKYDDARGVKFETYAITRINGAILDALRSLDWVPRAVRQRARELERVYQELELEFGRAPREEEVAARLGLSVRELDQLVQRVRGTAVLSLEEFLPNEKGYEIPLVDTLKDDESDVTSEVESREVRAELVSAVESLSPQERTVIKLYYFDGQTLKEIKGALGVSESRVSQIHAQAVIHLRQKLKELRADLGYREDDPNVKQKYLRKPPPESDSRVERISRGEVAGNGDPTSGSATGLPGRSGERGRS